VPYDEIEVSIPVVGVSMQIFEKEIEGIKAINPDDISPII